MYKNQKGNIPSDIPLENEQDQGDITHNEGYTISRGIQSVISVSILIATLLTLWNPRKVFVTPNLVNLFQSGKIFKSYDTDQLNYDGNFRIGILAGHWQNSPGEVCADGVIEADINHDIASRVKLNLEETMYKVDLFQEFDLDFLNYEADALVAVYSGSCLESPPPPSGFKIGTSLTTENTEEVNNLAVCLGENYQNHTDLPFTYEIINPDHPSFHIFRDIHPDTPAVLIEIGTLSTDRDLIINRSNSIAEGISAGIRCYVENTSENLE